jgi:hypothetical protein
MTIDEMIQVLMAAKAGKEIQAKKKENPNAPGWWSCSMLSEPNFQDYDYRVKPEPREWWIEPHPSFYACNTPQRASSQSATLHYQEGPNYIHVREVLE